MAQQPDQLQLRKYSPNKFANRDREVNLILDKADRLMQEENVKKRTTIFMGTRGTGKSWLLAHLKTRLLTKLSNVIVFSLDLKDYDKKKPTLAVIDALSRLSVATEGPSKGLGVTPADMSRKLMQCIQPRLKQQILVLLVDHVYESNWKLLAAMEDYLLAPLAVKARVLIVMAGRGRPYPWKTPELRLEADFQNLEPFPDEATTREQLKHLELGKALLKADKIHELSGGNPLANLQLAIDDDPVAALNRVINEMLEVPEEDRPRLRECLEAVCVLRSFDEERIPTMLAAHRGTSRKEELDDAQARDMRKELVKQDLARWDTEKGGYVLDELTQKLLDRYLREARYDRWIRLHQAALKLYKDWAKIYELTKDSWEDERKHHESELQSARSKRTPDVS